MEVYSVIFGVIVGSVAGFIACKQQFSKWKARGFARGRTPEEKKMMLEIYNTDTKPVFKKPWFRVLTTFAAILAILMASLLKAQVGFAVLLSIVTGIVFVIISLILIVFISDGMIRKQFLEQKQREFSNTTGVD